jgi:hypothetical protein
MRGPHLKRVEGSLYALSIRTLDYLHQRDFIFGVFSDGSSRVWAPRDITHDWHQGEECRPLHEGNVYRAGSRISRQEPARLTRGSAHQRRAGSPLLEYLAQICAGEPVPRDLQSGSGQGIGWGTRACLPSANAKGIHALDSHSLTIRQGAVVFLFAAWNPTR